MMDPSRQYYHTFTAPASSGSYYYTRPNSGLRSTTMGSAYVPELEEPTNWDIEITKAERETAHAVTLDKAADEDLELDPDDETARSSKNKAQRVLDRWPVLQRYLEAMSKSEKNKKDATLSSAKKEESRRAAETCKKALDDYDNALKKGEGKDGKDIKKE